MKSNKLKRSPMAKAARANLEKKLEEQKRQNNIMNNTFDIKKINKNSKSMPTWGILRDAKENINKMLANMRDMKNDMVESKKFLFFSRLADPGLFAHATQYLAFVERDIDEWQKNINVVFSVVDCKFGRINEQEDLILWRNLAESVDTFIKGITNTIVPSFQLFDSYFNTFVYDMLGIDIPSYMVLEDKVQKQMAVDQFSLAVKKYNLSLEKTNDPEYIEKMKLPDAMEFFKSATSQPKLEKKQAANDVSPQRILEDAFGIKI